MSEFEENREVYQKSSRGTYIIFPLKYDKEMKLKELTLDDAKEEAFVSEDWSDLLIKRCKGQERFVRRFILEKKIDSIRFEDGTQIPVEQLQVFVFENGIAFLSVLLVYENSRVQYVYDFINPGYVNDGREKLRTQVVTLAKELKVNGMDGIFRMYVEAEENAIKESYLFHAALVEKRFDHLETLEKTSFNVHKIIDLSREFEDQSEIDIAYTYGARDVDLCTFRWGACISSQSISYVYAVPDTSTWNAKKLIDTTEDDLLLTLLVLYQKNTCMSLNEEIQETISNHRKLHFFRDVMVLKKRALVFRASGTLTPSQVSRWNNVCETYRNLVEVNGINEALEEIEQKIDLIKDEQERKSSEVQNYIATVIAVFGLISIVAAVLQIVDLMEGGSQGMIESFWLSCLGAVMLGVSWIIMIIKKK